MAILAIDWGSKHLGLAISYAGVYAKELTVLANNRGLFGKLSQVIDEHKVSEIVVGLPRNDDGSEALLAKVVRRFAARLKQTLKLPVHFEDEHLTSKEAERLLPRVDPTSTRIDSASAKLILEQFLAGKGNEP